MHKSKENLVWIDLEMTGLDPENEGIIEIASIVTDKDLNIIDQGPQYVIHQTPKLLKAMDEWNQTQHTKSGLIELVKKSKVTVKKAEIKTIKFLEKYCYERKATLCGNSIHHDRRFIIKYMPKLSAFLHYRLVDVTAVRELVERWYPKTKLKPKKKDSHRALDDIRESIEELRFYREHYFK